MGKVATGLAVLGYTRMVGEHVPVGLTYVMRK